MEVAQMKYLLGAISIVLFLIVCIVGLVGEFITGMYKTSILSERLHEPISALKYALVTQHENYEDLAKLKTIVITRDSENGKLTIQALNTTPEELARKQPEQEPEE